MSIWTVVTHSMCNCNMLFTARTCLYIFFNRYVIITCDLLHTTCEISMNKSVKWRFLFIDCLIYKYWISFAMENLLILFSCLNFLILILLFLCREGAKVTWGYINRILGQPSLIRESSMAKFPWSGIISRGSNKMLNYSTVARAAAPAQNKSPFGDIILHPSLKKRIEHLARATANTKTHQAPFRNVLFYGPPGTGKTLVAREIARKSV